MSGKPYEVIVVGGGIMGAATADAVGRRGRRVLLVEQFEPGHLRGSSHGDGRIIRFAYPEPLYLELALRAYPAWAALEARAEQRLMQPTGGWDSGPADSAELAALEANFRRFAIPYERLSAAQSARRFPQLRLPEGSEALFQGEGGVLFATAAVQALWRMAQRVGVETVTGQRVVALEPSAEGVTVRTATALHWQGERVVICGGGWANTLLEPLGLPLPLEVTQEQVAYFLPRAGAADHRAGAMPVFIDYHSPAPFYGLPQIEVPGVKVGWHHTGPQVDPDAPRALDEANLAALSAFVAERLPQLDPTPRTPVACLYTNSPDHHFILDRHPTLPQIVVGSGFSGHGFKFGPVIGELLADLALGEEPPLSLDSFALARFTHSVPLARRTGA